MVAREGSAPSTSSCRPDVMLFHHETEKIGCLACFSEVDSIVWTMKRRNQVRFSGSTGTCFVALRFTIGLPRLRRPARSEPRSPVRGVGANGGLDAGGAAGTTSSATPPACRHFFLASPPLRAGARTSRATAPPVPGCPRPPPAGTAIALRLGVFALNSALGQPKLLHRAKSVRTAVVNKGVRVLCTGLISLVVHRRVPTFHSSLW
jgi:hypothetical protein